MNDYDRAERAAAGLALVDRLIGGGLSTFHRV
jgi:hypothetical protein